MRLYGERHPASKLTDQDVMNIRHLWDIGHRNVKVIASNYRISPANVMKIVNEKTWKHLIKWPSKTHL